MSVLDDFFGDGQTAEPHCSCCDLPESEQDPYIVTIQDNYGPTHWMHKSCKVEYEKERAKESARRQASGEGPDFDRDTAGDGVE